jgi:hypothetical protein
MTNDAFPMDGYYKTDVISGVGHRRSDSIVLLVVHTVRCANGWDTGIVLQVPRDSVKPDKKGNISDRPYC